MLTSVGWHKFQISLYIFCAKAKLFLCFVQLLLLLLGVRGKPRMYRSLLAYCTARFLL
jgi:hypothetical protein